MKHLLLIAGLTALSTAACAGKNGTDGSSCSVTPNPDGSATISCTNGTTTTVEPGTAGATGASGTSGVVCTVADNGSGTSTITCPGSSATVSDGHGPCGTLKGDLNVANQLDIAVFQAAGCTEIDGNLNITSYGTLTSTASIVGDLSGFSNLTEVTGTVDIDGASDVPDSPNDPLQATSLQGFQNLTEVGGDLDINDTTWATDANLASLTTVGGHLDIEDNSALLSVELPLLRSVGSWFYFEGNNAITGITLTALSSISGPFQFVDNTPITELDLSSVTMLAGDATINGNTNLTDLNLSGLTDQNTPGASLYVTNNGALKTVELTNLTSAQSIQLNNTVATTLDFPALTTVGDSLTIDNNADLSTLTFGAAAVDVGETVDVSHDSALNPCNLQSILTGATTATYDNDAVSC